jgi:regulatory protein YycI of two-component signal transduction system YycFG
MDWRRVKTILIIALIFINSLLAFIIFENRKKDTSDVIERNLILDLLEKRNIEINDDLFNINRSLSNISLKLQTYNTTTYEKTLKQASLFEQNENVRHELKIEQGKALSFKTYGGMLNPVSLSEEAILENAYKLIRALGFSEDEVYLKSMGRTHEKTIVTFGQKINDFVLRDSEMIIKYNNDNLLEFYRLWYDVLDEETDEFIFYEPEYALYEFLIQLDTRFPNRKRSLKITDFDLVYQLSPDEVPDIENSVLEGEARIYYRVLTSDQEVFLIQGVED